MRAVGINFDNILLDKKFIWKYFDSWHFMQNLLRIKNYCVLGSIKHMDLSKFMVELDI